ncbi:hypothetical protein BO70DRAFT_394716 [Aspergillus heteromorphus CBS 117.55]|uniref:Uncharacterized protein n=1 Tax=Aspergillus heteromorphus CBS 117.55 TaxID=1448321 RepID=A0A317WP43_9EURO|nr:uncharacterized protein BO70DRAFT_394716 [Aspergillus heteromorphus CBS 117.55]PWY86698.1 hypothetical protein BO70DRAFT_394716 [Aspergillus heteromorphus CBS 117.55]
MAVRARACHRYALDASITGWIISDQDLTAVESSSESIVPDPRKHLCEFSLSCTASIPVDDHDAGSEPRVQVTLAVDAAQSTHRIPIAIAIIPFHYVRRRWHVGQDPTGIPAWHLAERPRTMERRVVSVSHLGSSASPPVIVATGISPLSDDLMIEFPRIATRDDPPITGIWSTSKFGSQPGSPAPDSKHSPADIGG